MTDYADVTLTVEDGVALLTFARPERRNAFTLPMLAEVQDALAAADADPAVRAVVITGAGERFSLGAELRGPDTLRLAVDDDLAGHTPRGYREPAGRISEQIAGMHVPVIGAVNGDAVGGGATILAAMDVRIMSDRARIGFVFTRRGVSPEGASTWFLPRLVGLGTATDWLISGRIIPAAEALSAGFATRLVPPEQVLETALEYARQFSTVTSPRSVALTRALLAASFHHPDPAAAAYAESAVYQGLTDTPDAKEGVLSFIEHRAPAFTSTGREH
ncbi:enoyl-CoA hydratase [Nakamurella sp. YIM 132087]|uniref:Enoyl-CoA hydratase n=1 Tax=Nakamurella alba TaxID=2665158 RepID=A0A7K1FLD1_9ACTN|nr:enoyl-CoA hydratase-related protein [Nakamurella alba]MTD14189.1 enoyl-CoA hydratase [Nakamurella alba]